MVKLNEQSPNQLLRELGFDNVNFFDVAAAWGIKVYKARRLEGGRVRIIFMGVEGNAFQSTQILPSLNGDSPLHPETVQKILVDAHTGIAQHNPAIRKHKGPAKAGRSPQT